MWYTSQIQSVYRLIYAPCRHTVLQITSSTAIMEGYVIHAWHEPYHGGASTLKGPRLENVRAVSSIAHRTVERGVTETCYHDH
jgi:hypothetical protein